MTRTRDHRQLRDAKDKALAKAWFTAGRTVDYVCPTCGASIADFSEKCTAMINVRCGGFETIEKAHAEFEGHWLQRVTEADL